MVHTAHEQYIHALELKQISNSSVIHSAKLVFGYQKVFGYTKIDFSALILGYFATFSNLIKKHFGKLSHLSTVLYTLYKAEKPSVCLHFVVESISQPS